MNKNDQLIHQGNLISLYREQVNLPDGRTTHYDIVRHPGGAVILATNERHEICLLRQYRHAIDDYIWELPAGCLEPEESALQTAQRELVEETGFTATDWAELGSIIPSPGFCNEVLWLFQASNLKPESRAKDSDEFLEPHWFKLDQIVEMAIQGEIRDAKTLAVLFFLQAGI